MTVYLGLITVWYLAAAVTALRRPLNDGADVIWLVVFVVAAVFGCISAVFVRKSGQLVFAVGIPLLSLALVVLSGRLVAAMIAIWLLALAGAWGGSVLRRLGVAVAGLEWLVIAVPLGLALLALAGLTLGIVHVLRPLPILVVLVCLTLVRWRAVVGRARSFRDGWRHLLDRSRTGIPPERHALFFALGGSWLLGLSWALAPEVQYDALNYQLAVPRMYLEQGRIVDLPYFFHSYFAHLGNMIFALGLALEGQAVAKLMSLATGVVVGAGVYALGRIALDARAALWAAALFCATPLVLWLAATTYVDLCATMFTVGGLVALLRWRESPSIGWIGVSGALVGAAVGTKLTAVVVVPAFLLVMAWTLWRGRPGSAGSALKAVSAYGLGGLVFACPWYAVVYWFTGNPFFPMFNAVFKSPGWAFENTRLNADMFGIGTSPNALLALPFALTFETQRFGEALPAGAMGLAVALLPVGALLLAFRGRHRVALLGAALLSVLIWGLLFQYARYLVPMLPVAVVAVVAAVFLASAHPWGLRLNLGCLGVVLVAQFAIAPTLFWNIPERFPVARALGLESAEAFAARAVPGYAASVYLNRVAAPGEKVVGRGDLASVRFYLDPPLVSEEMGAVLGVADGASPRELAAAMLAKGYAYVMVNTRASAPTGRDLLTRQDFFECCATPKFSRHGVVVYRIQADRTRPGNADNLLRNPGFELLTAGGSVDGWDAYGRPVVGGAGPQAHSGKVAIRSSAHAGLAQLVPVEAGRLYVLSHLSRAEEPGQQGRMQIHWLNDRRQLLEVAIEVVAADVRWTKHTFVATAPDGAVAALVYASVHGESRVWFDDFAFARAE